MFMAVSIFVMAFLFSPGEASARQWQLQTVDPGFFAAEITTSGNKVFARNKQGHWQRIQITANGVKTSPGKPNRLALPKGALPESTVATGQGAIRRAWFADPTGRYAHGILGDKLEGGELVVKTKTGKRLSYKLDNQSVFEDLVPRLVDLGAGNTDRILAVRTYLKTGGSLAVFGIRDGKLDQIAQTRPIGQSNRWLNPAGVADFDGDGRIEIAIVLTPHIGGTLQLWRLTGNRLVKVREAAGYSNHAIGSRLLGLSAIGDFTGDGVADLALPSDSRSVLRIVAFNRPSMAVADIPMPAKISGGMAAAGSTIIAALADGRLAIVRHRKP